MNQKCVFVATSACVCRKNVDRNNDYIKCLTFLWQLEVFKESNRVLYAFDQSAQDMNRTQNIHRDTLILTAKTSIL